MKILVLNPPFIGKYSRNSRSPAVTKGGTIYYPIWLSYAVGLLDKEEGFEIKFIDAPAEGYNIDDILKIAKEELRKKGINASFSDAVRYISNNKEVR